MPSNYYEQPSSFCGGVMLWKNEKVYVMDNHLSAVSEYQGLCPEMIAQIHRRFSKNRSRQRDMKALLNFLFPSFAPRLFKQA